MTTVFTHNPVRDDLPANSTASTVEQTTAPTNTSKLWAVSGLAASITGIATILATFPMDAVFDPATNGDADKILDRMIELKGMSTVFHVLATVTALLLVPFATGIYRRLRSTLPSESLLPGVAAVGVAMTSVIMIMGAGLDTEFGFGMPDSGHVLAENVAFYNHWVGTIPYLWTGIGLAGLALFAAAQRHRGVPRWIGVVGLLLGGLTVLTGVSPLEYMAGMVGPIWLLVTTIGFLAGDRAHRQ